MMKERHMAIKNGRVALLAGATGLVGREILSLLLADQTVAGIYCLGRRAPEVAHGKLTFLPVNFSALPELPKADDCFIALGTTIKVAGSQSAFRAIDLDAVVALALAAKQAGVTRVGVISAMGANAQSRVFYNRVKGEMEINLARMGFKSLVIARPSLIDGDRAALHQAGRAGEGLGLMLARALRGFIPANYRAVAAADVARTLVDAVNAGTPGVETLMSGAMQG
jgi:uncharacterized protein YbjT (DUF2867 family)